MVCAHHCSVIQNSSTALKSHSTYSPSLLPLESLASTDRFTVYIILPLSLIFEAWYYVLSFSIPLSFTSFPGYYPLLLFPYKLQKQLVQFRRQIHLWVFVFHWDGVQFINKLETIAIHMMLNPCIQEHIHSLKSPFMFFNGLLKFSSYNSCPGLVKFLQSVFVFISCITNHHKLKQLKMMGFYLIVCGSCLGTGYSGCLLRVSSGRNQGVSWTTNEST